MKKIVITQLLSLIFVASCLGAEYKVEKYPVSSSVNFHIKEYLGDTQTIYKYSARYCGKDCSVLDIFKIDGVEKVVLDGYKISVTIGEAFCLDEITTKIERIIKNPKCNIHHKFFKNDPTLYSLYSGEQHIPHECLCNETSFYRGQTVWDVVSGEGIIKSIKQDSSILYTIYVAFPGGAVRVYTMDGKHFETDLLPSLYPYKVKIIEDK